MKTIFIFIFIFDVLTLIRCNKMERTLDFDKMKTYEKFCSCNNKECKCGEENVHEWAWDETLVTTASLLSQQNLEVKFHPVYSDGTTAVRGNRAMDSGRHHYWEVKMLTKIYGTDVMVGVGTANAQLDMNNQFCSLLGYNRESWGFSYRGYIQHAGETKDYADSFGQGCLVGVHLDTWKGNLQFFVNRKPLGIAYTGLRNMTLYPMVSSTAAQSKVRITYSCSTPASLQMDCLALLRPLQRSYLSAAFPGLRYLSKSIFADILRKYSDDEEDNDYEFPEEFLILDDFDYALVGFGRRRKRKKLEPPTSSGISIDSPKQSFKRLDIS